MPVMTLPDGSERSFDRPVTVAEVAASIGKGLAKAALAGVVNGQLVEAQRQHTDGRVVLEAWVPSRVLQTRRDRLRISLQVPELLRPCDLNPASVDKRKLGLGIGRISLQPAGNRLQEQWKAA